MKPLLKWVGGKRRFLKFIKEEINEYKNYYEPFAGSAALMFDLEPNNKIFINDLNGNLINFYKAIKLDWKRVVDRTRELIREKDKKEDYYKLRVKYNERVLNNSNNKDVDFEEASMFLYLNKVGFNGMYRVNSKGEFNIPKGKYKSPYIPTDEEMTKAQNLFKRTKITSGLWHKSIQGATKGDLVYLDPPYFPDESSKFLGYTNPVFDEKSHDEMVKISKELVDKGVKVLISNSASLAFEKIVKREFGDLYKRINIQTKRTINPSVKNKAKFVETLYVLGGDKLND